MPDSPSAAPAPVAPETPLVEVTFKRNLGKTTLTLKNKGFLDYLKSIGAMTDTGKLLANPGWADGIDAYRNAICAGALVKHSANGEYDIKVESYYTGVVSTDAMRAVAKSVTKTVNEVLEYFRPIEVSAKVMAKAL